MPGPQSPELLVAYNSAQSAEVAKRRVRVAQLLGRKITQLEIAQTLNVDPSTISVDVAALMEGWREAAQAGIADHVAKELAELDQMERDCVTQFINNPNPKWLQVRLDIKDKKYRLLGLYKQDGGIGVADDSPGTDDGRESIRSRIDSIAARLRTGGDFTGDSTDAESTGGTAV